MTGNVYAVSSVNVERFITTCTQDYYIVKSKANDGIMSSPVGTMPKILHSLGAIGCLANKESRLQ